MRARPFAGILGVGTGMGKSCYGLVRAGWPDLLGGDITGNTTIRGLLVRFPLWLASLPVTISLCAAKADVHE